MATTKERIETRGLPERYHLEGCPDTRTETFVEKSPPSPLHPYGQPHYVTRCIDCGGQRIQKGA